MSGHLSDRVRSGVLWLAFINAVSRGSQMAVTLVLAAIFTESDLGVVALAMALVNAAMVLQVMGVSHVISRTEHDEHVMAGTVLTLSLIPSVLLTVTGYFGASRLASALGAPAAAPVIATVALGLPFMAIAWIQMALMHRHLDFRRRLLPDVGGALASAVVTVVLAALGTGPISVAIGYLVGAVLQPLFGLLVGVRVRPRWDRAAAGEAWHWVTSVGPGAVAFTLLINVDFPIISRILGPEELGLYSLAFRIGWAPYLFLSVVLASVAFPAYARLVREGRRDELPAAVARVTHALLVAVGGMYVVLVLMADRIVLLGDRWRPAVPVLMVLCAYGLALSVLTLWYETIIVAGHLRVYLLLEVGHLALLVIGLSLLARHGIVAAATVQVAAVWTVVGAVWLTMTRSGCAPTVSALVRAVLGFLPPAASCVALVAAGRWAGLEPEPESLGGAVLEMSALVVCYAVVAVLTNRSLVTTLLTRRGQAAR